MLTLPSKAGADISECSVVVSPPPGAFPRGQGRMQHVVNKALTHTENDKHGSAGHNQGRGRAPQAPDVQVFGGPIQ